MPAIDEHVDVIKEWRIQGFADLGFNDYQASILADVVDNSGFALYWGDMKRFLNQGATHQQLVEIFS